MSNPLLLLIITNDATAAAMGEHVIPTWDATDATAQGRSGRMPFLSDISQMMGIRV
jgi:hypothetical protein